MAATAFTKIASSPHMLRYYVSSTDGANGSVTATQLLSDCMAGPLKGLIAQLNVNSWGTIGSAISATNPAGNAKISVTLTPYTANSGATCAAASYQFYNSASTNLLEVRGGIREDSTVLLAFVSAILEIRYNHSIER